MSCPIFIMCSATADSADWLRCSCFMCSLCSFSMVFTYLSHPPLHSHMRNHSCTRTHAHAHTQQQPPPCWRTENRWRKYGISNCVSPLSATNLIDYMDCDLVTIHSFIHSFVFVDPSLVHNHWI